MGGPVNEAVGVKLTAARLYPDSPIIATAPAFAAVVKRTIDAGAAAIIAATMRASLCRKAGMNSPDNLILGTIQSPNVYIRCPHP